MKTLALTVAIVLSTTFAFAACTDEEAKKIVEIKRLEEAKDALNESIAQLESRKVSFQDKIDNLNVEKETNI